MRLQASDYTRKNIKEYLDAFAERDEAFALSYENPQKSIEECCDYICTQVQKSGSVFFHDDEIYGMAVHYYQEQNLGEIAKGLTDRCNIVTNHAVELTEEEKAEAKQRAVEELVAAEKRKIQEKEKKDKEVAKAKEEAKQRYRKKYGLVGVRMRRLAV